MLNDPTIQSPHLRDHFGVPTMIVLVAVFALVGALKCNSDECMLRAVLCTAQPSQCQMSAVGLVVMDATHAKAMCANVSLEIVAPGDSIVNDEMKRLCPSAAFFDIRAKAAASQSACNQFVIESTGELATFFSWGTEEPNNGISFNKGDEVCSKGPIEEDCVAFEPYAEVSRKNISACLPFDADIFPKPTWIDRKCSSYGQFEADTNTFLHCRCVVCGSLLKPPTSTATTLNLTTTSTPISTTISTTTISTTTTMSLTTTLTTTTSGGANLSTTLSTFVGATNSSDSLRLSNEATSAGSETSNDIFLYVLIPLLSCVLVLAFALAVVLAWRRKHAGIPIDSTASEIVDRCRNHGESISMGFASCSEQRTSGGVSGLPQYQPLPPASSMAPVIYEIGNLE